MVVRIRTKFNITLMLILSSILIVTIVVGMIKYSWSLEQHKQEIYRVIKEKGGQVVQINKNEGPFKDEIRTANTVYEIIYEKDGELKKAWYRTTRGAIHVEIDNSHRYKDKWIWEEDEKKKKQNHYKYPPLKNAVVLFGDASFQILQEGATKCLYAMNEQKIIDCEINTYKIIDQLVYVLPSKGYILLNLEDNTYKYRNILDSFEEEHQKEFMMILE